MNNSIQIHFLGAAGTVTGSKYLIETDEHRVMIDCGLFQGLKELRQLNWVQPPVDPGSIDLVLLTHGHMDHTGFLPRLVKMGYKGDIIGTGPTLDVAEVILRDSGRIQEEEAERANREGYSKHHPAEPLYTLKQAEYAITRFRPIKEGEWMELFDGWSARFSCNGHIIGSTFIELDVNGTRLVFSGDIGREEDLLMRPPKRPERADYLFVESTYGNRLHQKEDVAERLAQIVHDTVAKGGTLIIPSFAVERTQTLMYLLWKLHDSKRIPDIPMIMDSPMGKNVLNIFHKNAEWHKLPIADCTKMCNTFRVVSSFKETWEIMDDRRPKIVVAGSGMISGGRVLNYLQSYIDRPETTVLLAGYQADGTRGRKLLEGAETLKIYGKPCKVEAEVLELGVLSAHADQKELLNWMSDIEKPPKRTFIIHGEKQAAEEMGHKIEEQYGWDVTIPELFAIEQLD